MFLFFRELFLLKRRHVALSMAVLFFSISLFGIYIANRFTQIQWVKGPTGPVVALDNQSKVTNKTLPYIRKAQPKAITVAAVESEATVRDIKDTQIVGQQNIYYTTSDHGFVSDVRKETLENQVQSIVFNLPPRNFNFTGRGAALLQIKQQLDQQKLGIITQAISGMGGVGKTQLATEFAYQAAERKEYSVIFWVPSETVDAVNNAYKEFAEFLQIDVRGFSPGKVQLLVHRELVKRYHNTKDAGILFILDNVSSYDSIQNYIQELNKQLSTNLKLYILITSRSQHWPEQPLILDTFTPQEAISFVKKHLPDEKESSIVKLIETMYYFPLALSQATAYIKKHTNIDDYLKLYAAKQKDYLNRFPDDGNQYKESLWKTWDISINKLSDTAKEILFISSYLYPDDIPIAFFDNLDVEKRGEAIEELRKHSFIIIINNKSFKIHRLLQEVIRISLANRSKCKNAESTKNMKGAKNVKNISSIEIDVTEKRFNELIRAIALLKTKFNFSYARLYTWNLCGQYLMHAQSLAEYAISTKNESLYTIGMQLYSQVAMYITYVYRDNKNAKKIWEKIFMLVEQHYNKDKSSILVMANINTHLSHVMHQLGNRRQERKYLERAISIYESKIPNMSVTVNELLIYLRWDQNIASYDGIKCDQSYALYNWGYVKRDIGAFKIGKDSLEKAFEMLDKCKLTSCVMIYKVIVLHNLSKFYIYCGDINNAKNVLNSAKIMVDKYFPNHLEQIYVYEDIAGLLYYMGMYDEAKENLEKCLKSKLSVRPKDHHEIGITKSILGSILCATNYIDEGIADLKQAEIIYNKNFEEGHYRFIFLYIRMSNAFEMHKEYDRALQYLIKAQKIVIKHYGEKPCVILSQQSSPIEKFPSLEISERNINYYSQACDIVKTLYGVDHIKVARYYYLLGQVFENIRDKKKGRQYYQEALNIANKQHFDNEILLMGHQKNIKIIQERLEKL